MRRCTRACRASGRRPALIENAIDIEILYEDEHLYVLDKPSGLLVHTGYGRDEITIVDWVYDVLERKPHPLHRLDRQTSGTLLFAKSPEIARDLQVQFGDSVEKIYAALVRGVPKEPGGVVDHPVPRSEDGPRVDALSHWALVASAETEPRHTSIVCVRPVTGRFHQIRRHMSHLHHPLINDSNYGATKLNRALRERYGLGRMALHARSITFDHPVDGRRLRVVSEWPADLKAPLSSMGFDWDEINQFFDTPFSEGQQ